ncbi:MAG: sulfite exporter TauE/SafE family protein [Ignavibacteriae bacterium]|nr:sulfite exporter TauE/SafE family protein [Ignavibacteriota bacterium]MCB9215845.1 sulfite exporter TauE/SafE family protein [Ignavibacteria bacterium]
MEVLYTILVGILTGFSAGMFGIGGALLSTPLLHELVGLPDLTALATPLPATLPAALSGSIIYFRERLLRTEILKWVLISGLPCNILGAWLVKSVSGSMMMILTGIFILYAAVLFLSRSMKGKRSGGGESTSKRKEEPEVFSPLLLLTIGGVAGFLSGFLAIGGGMVMVPAFVGLLRLPTKQALATSLVCVAAFSIPGMITHHLNGFIDWKVAGILCATVFPMSALGARATTKLRSETVELSFGVGMLIFAILFILKNL